jgi:hypothetical protein
VKGIEPEQTYGKQPQARESEEERAKENAREQESEQEP